MILVHFFHKNMCGIEGDRKGRRHSWHQHCKGTLLLSISTTDTQPVACLRALASQISLIIGYTLTMTNHVIQPTTLQLSKAMRMSSQPLLCVWRASALWLQDGARSQRAAGGDIESPPEKINNALVCKWPVLTLRLSWWLELLWPLTGADRLCLREIPSHRWHHRVGEWGRE